VSSESELLASLGPVVGVSRLVRGEMTRQEYLAEYGHRGPYETEFAAPRPAEDPAWLDEQIAQLGGSSVDAGDLLARQEVEFAAAWRRFENRHPAEVAAMRTRLDLAAEVIRVREATRSELARQVWAGRAWALRAAELVGLGDDLFFLLFAEVVDLLAGKDVALDTLPARKTTHQRYQALPPYPQAISGQFDPFAWAADPNRRTDLFDSHVPVDSIETRSAEAHIVKGIPGSGGRAEGRVRRIDRPEEGDQLQQNEILVTSQTNIGWTLFFPRLAAVVTDVGAPLSHAAIVARELGIPAVVGCGDATARLRTGDLVRVDGDKGIVERVGTV
jgi:pyruvate,water dikinase